MTYARIAFISKELLSLIASAGLFFASISVAAGATINLINLDGPGEGFNDNSAPFLNQTGNNGMTLGQQRLNVFRAAADFWEAQLISSVDITVDINMDPLDCNANGAVLGAAGPNQAASNFANAPLPNVAYVIATANSLAGVDLDPGNSDIGATFNVDIDNNNACLNGTNWWLGIDSPAPPGTISLYDTVLHEIAHGLGVSSLVALAPIPQFGIVAGDFFTGNTPPIYAVNLRDETLGLTWGQMNSAQRAFSSTNTGNLVWNGNSANNNSDHLAAVSRTNGRIRMYAPNPVEGGSSVSHWDIALSPDELMEPFATPMTDERSTLQLLEDVGWELVGGPGELNFTSSTLTVFEDREEATIRVARTGGIAGAASVTVQSQDITANAGADYQAVNTTLSWADREGGVKTVTVAITNDDIEEPDGETVSFSLVNLVGDVPVGDTDSLVLTIRDPDEGFLLDLIPAIISGSQRSR